ncbi:MAG: DUF2017 domain-containing protein [Actinomycetales bacterium]|nr:DUF2017 domain-containing protein [Actinomycetales bacterium]
MKPFKRRRKGGIAAEFEPNEALLLSNLAAQMIELLRDRNGSQESSADPLAQMVGMSGPIMPPEDPVLNRLLPDAYRDDPDNAAEFRRYTEQMLTSQKVTNAQALIDALIEGGLSEAEHSRARIEVELNDGAAIAWMKTLTDIRLALGIRLGIETEADMELLEQEAEEYERQTLDIYEWLGFVQETLVEAASR